MEELHIAHHGEYQRMGSEFSGGNWIHLLFNDSSFEATVDIIPKGTVGCLYNLPQEDFEFNYILKGQLEIFVDGKKVQMGVGDTFTFYTLTRNYMFRALEDSEFLNVRKTPCFGSLEDSVTRLNKVLATLSSDELKKRQKNTLRPMIG